MFYLEEDNQSLRENTTKMNNALQISSVLFAAALPMIREAIWHRRGAMSQLKNLKRTVLLWLMLFAIGFSSLGCNSNNHAAKLSELNKRTIAGGKASTQTKRTTAAVPVATSGRIAKHRSGNKASGLGDAINGLGKALKGTAKFTLDAAVVGGTVAGIVIGSMFLDYQVWRLQDKMF